MKLESKRILIISPQEWGSRSVSKHHYSIELAKKGNKVFFLGPPERSIQTSVKPSEIENLFIVYHNFRFNRNLRFHFRWLYDVFTKQHVKSINKIVGKIDIVWCFEPNLYKSLNWFNATFNLYHPVDIVFEKIQLDIGDSADIILSVAQNILDKFQNSNTSKYFINHGLSKEFSFKHEIKKDSNIRFAYIGNLMIKGLDRDKLKRIILNNPLVTFDFYGNYSLGTDDFIDFLEKQNNANLLGLKSTKELATLLRKYSGFLLCYNPKVESNAGSNSHKILEYLSFGKVIVANKIYHYEEHRDLIQMSKTDDNSDYVQLFEDTLSNLEKLNSEELINKRKQLAFNNTYSKQIDRIEAIIIEKMQFLNRFF